MLLPDRLKSQMETHRVSQAELARRVGIKQPTIHKLLTGQNYGSKHIHRIARALQTTPEYLTGEIDDPDEGAPPPPPKPTVQVVTMPMLLPGEEALKQMFLGVLKASPGMSEDELALELAKSLPSGLQLLRGRLIYDDQAGDDDLDEPAIARSSAAPVRRQA